MRVYLRALGCRLNQSEIDTMARQFQQQGHDVVDDPAAADWVVINTCTVTGDAARKSRQLVRDVARAGVGARIAVTGCHAQVAPDEFTALPGVAYVVDNLQKDALVGRITGVPVAPFDLEPLARSTGIRSASGRTRAFVKAQDGCDNACTFCITTIARGAARSRSLADIVDEIRLLVALGYQEAVLTGTHLGSYGHDRGERDGLSQLVRAVLADTDVPRLRLSSLEPWDLDETFFALWDNPRLCPHLHLPLQSGCDATLRRMRRRTNQNAFRALVTAARARVPDISITTDVIVGFPGETDEEFAISEAFIREMAFAGLHVFRYSRRPGTAAARMRGQVAESVKRARSSRLHALAKQAGAEYAHRFIERRLPVLWEQVGGAQQDGFINLGYTHNYIRVRCVHPRPLTNCITPARLDAFDGELFTVTPELP
ncbi:MAG: tRNA (N(6)-L-threonylcarbamoyladenosine(37)-C(2))-methylthiotransferase MtaB [Aggregatilineales bacterium]